MSKYHRTAMSRKNFSTPVQHLLKEGKLSKDKTILDYGCGRGGDVQRLANEGYKIEGFDPNGEYNNEDVLDVQYDTVMCNFVLNVIQDEVERIIAEEIILFHLKEGGTAYIAVRNDKNVAGGCTSTGTWQDYVEPFNKGWELVTSNSKFKMWKLTK